MNEKQVWWCGYCGRYQECNFDAFMAHLDFCESELAMQISKGRNERGCKGTEDRDQP